MQVRLLWSLSVQEVIHGSLCVGGSITKSEWENSCFGVSVCR